MPKRSHDDEEDYESLRKKYRAAKKQRKRKNRRRRRHKENRSPTPDSSTRSSREVSPELLNSSKESQNISPSSPVINCEQSHANDPRIDDIMVQQELNAETVMENGPVSDLTVDEPGLSKALPEEEGILDSDILEILGDDPTNITNYGKDIQKDLAVRLQHIVTSGLSKEDRKELVDKYLIPSNAKLINAPVLNPEMKAPTCLTDHVIKRDKAIYFRQKQMASAIASLSNAITLQLSSKQKDPEMLKLLMDTARNICDLQNSDSLVRRNYVLSSLKKDMKEQLKLSKIDSHLFGEDLPDTLKSVKTLSTNAAYLKDTTSKPPPKKPHYNNTKPLNPKGPYPVRRQQGTSRTNQYQPAHSQRNQPSNSSRQYRPQQQQQPPQQPYSRNYRR